MWAEFGIVLAVHEVGRREVAYSVARDAIARGLISHACGELACRQSSWSEWFGPDAVVGTICSFVDCCQRGVE